MNLNEYAVDARELDLTLSRWEGPVVENANAIKKACDRGMVVSLNEALASGVGTATEPKLAAAPLRSDSVSYRSYPHDDPDTTEFVAYTGKVEWRHVVTKPCLSGWGTRMVAVPQVPTTLLPADWKKRRNRTAYVVLFEVEQWVRSFSGVRAVQPDPALLRLVAGDLYEVVAMWDLTDLERRAIQGGTSRGG